MRNHGRLQHSDTSLAPEVSLCTRRPARPAKARMEIWIMRQSWIWGLHRACRVARRARVPVPAHGPGWSML